MTSIDDLFKRPVLPGATKRKLELSRNPNEIYKSPKLSTNGNAKGREHLDNGDLVTDAHDEDAIAGPELPPDEDEGVPEDDEGGRFFGGGVSTSAANALDIVDAHDAEEDATPEKIDVPWLRRLGLNFEKRISKNSELRAKFEDDPQKFMASEADLDADIKALSILSDHPELYTEFAKLGFVTSMVSLLAHENTDIAIDTIEVIAELTDEDVQADQSQWDSLIEALLEADLLSLLIQNFKRLDESNESDRSGVYHSLNLVENLASQPMAADKIARENLLITWLIDRIQKKETKVTQNKQYSAEILAIVLQSSTKSRPQFIEMDGVDICLQLLSSYRKRDPEKDSDEEEFAENLFNCLTCAVDEVSGKEKFLDAEGVELCLIMIKEGHFSKPRALRILDHAAGSQKGVVICEKIVDAAGLKPLFAMFTKHLDNANAEHILGIFASLLRSLPGNSAPRIRTLAKFMEKDYWKIDKLVQLRFEYHNRVIPIERKIEEEKDRLSPEERDAMEDQWLSDRLEAGLFVVQTADVILAWLAAEDSGARRKITTSLAEHETSLKTIQSSLQEQLNALRNEKEPEAQSDAEMLRTLIECL